jgi:DNA-binding NarL/FixJ family response regulator
VLLIIDEHKLRGASLESLLSNWAKSREVAIKHVAPRDVLREFDGTANWRLIIFNVGGASLNTGEFGTLVKVVPSLAGDAPTVVVADREEPAEIVSAYRANCRGFLPTNMAPALAFQALSFVMDGGSYFPPSALGAIEFPPPRPQGNGGPPRGSLKQQTSLQLANNTRETAEPSDPLPKDKAPRGNANFEVGPEEETDQDGVLTPRQQEVLELLRVGQPNKVIARALGLSAGTVKVHVRQIMRKYGAANRTEVAVLCVNWQRGVGSSASSEFRMVDTHNTGMPRSAA